MSFKTLLEPITDSGIKNTHFFEGRLLSGKDLTEQEYANKLHRQQLGQIIGHGIVSGLDVSIEKKGVGAEDPVVRINQGMAITLEGDVVQLPLEYIDIQLSRTLESLDPDQTGFKNCSKEASETLVASEAGLYILVMSPANQYREYAPKSGLQKQGIAHNCGRAYVVEGVQFRLVKFNPSLMPGVSESVKTTLETELLTAASPVDADETPGLSMMRNLVAHICLGSEQAYAFATEPTFIFEQTVPIGLDALLGLEEGFARCDTPLALLYWTNDGIVFIDNWVVRRMAPQATAGLLRINQFSHQLDWLRKELGNAEETAIADYFRFVPPAAYVPHRVVNSATGYRPEHFLQGYYRGVNDQSQVGQLNRFLRESLDFPSLDLSSDTYLQLFTPLNLVNLPDVFAQQPYFLYLSRGLFLTAIKDTVSEVIENTWQVYHGLVNKQVFLPPATDAEKVTARLTISNALNEILAVANRYVAVSANSGLDFNGAMRAFSALYSVQAEMVAIFTSTIPGIDDNQERDVFTNYVQRILAIETPPDAGPSYQDAVQASDLNAALDSQIEINRFVGQWSGEGVAVGPFGFTYQGSPQGTNLVRGEPIPHLFNLVNGTNKDLTFDLEVNVFADTGDWANSATILRALGGGEISRLNAKSGETRPLVVMTTAPSGAIEGESVTIELTATAGPPTSRSSTYINAELLHVDEELGDPVAGVVTINDYEFIGAAGPVDITDLDPGSIVTLRAFISYEVADVTTADFALDVVVESAPSDEWQFFRSDSPDPLPQDPPGTYTLALPGLTGNNTQNDAELRIVTPPARNPRVDNTLSFRLHIRSTSLPEAISSTHADTINLTLRASG